MESYCICECTVQLKIIVCCSIAFRVWSYYGYVGVVTSEREWSHQNGSGHIRKGVVTSKREWSHQNGSGHIREGVVTSKWEWSHWKNGSLHHVRKVPL